SLFPPPTEAWLQRVSSDPEAQGWGVWSWTEKTPLRPEGGKVEDDEEDTGFPPFLLDREDLSEDLAEYSVPDQVDYEVTAEELEAYFNICGEVQQVTILCNKFSGHPKGYAYIEFATESSAQAAVGLDKSIFQGQVIKVYEPHESPGHLEVGALGCMGLL
ncbi:Embryonic polyadenylate-binding protein 2, partial [Myotis brandtii]